MKAYDRPYIIHKSTIIKIKYLGSDTSDWIYLRGI